MPLLRPTGEAVRITLHVKMNPNSQAAQDAIERLCHENGVSVHQVGDVYGDAPPEILRKWFVAVTGNDFPDIDVAAIPLADSQDEAYVNAVKHLGLKTLN